METTKKDYSSPIVKVTMVVVEDGFKLSTNELSLPSGGALEHVSWNGETHYGNDFN